VVRVGLALLLVAVLSCSDPGHGVRVAATQPRIGLDQDGKVFALATTLSGERSPSARLREAAARATGAILPEFIDEAGNPLLAANAARLRGTCGVTFIAPSYAVTAAHCVDDTALDTDNLVVEMYRPTPELDQGFLRATALEGLSTVRAATPPARTRR
jgi:hypothetical protein